MLYFAVGDAPTWVLAVGTIGTLSVSLRLLRQSREDKRVEQARLVSAWKLDTTAEPDGYKMTFMVRNNSEEPVYSVTLQVGCGVRGTFVRRLDTLGPAERRLVAILLPGSPRGEFQPSLGFTDAAGRQWLRGYGGTLKEPTPRELNELNIEEAGAWDSIEKHPTLRLNRPGYELRGVRLDEGVESHPRHASEAALDDD
jgi:hypothetical protein